MGIYNAELFNNLGLCCFYAQQYDMTVTCFEQALSLAADEAVADVWYNIAHVAIVSQINEFVSCLSRVYNCSVFECFSSYPCRVCPQNMCDFESVIFS
jgi:tetratricopeptide (TPR) repeat protein